MLAIHEQLKTIANRLSLSIPTVDFSFTISDSPQHGLKQNRKLGEQNNILYGQIIDAARKKSEEYNSTALKAIILSLSMKDFSEKHTDIAQSATQAYSQHLNTKSTSVDQNDQTTAQLPEPGAIYPFLQPDLEFRHLKQQTDSHSVFRYRAELNHATISQEKITSLAVKVDRLIGSDHNATEALTGWLAFFTALIALFKELYNKVMERINDTSNVTAVIEGRDVNKIAKDIHRFNSCPSPLVQVIYDPQLTESEKLGLLGKLAQAKPYRFKDEPPEERKNIDIPSTVLDAKLNDYSPEGTPLHHAVKNGTSAMVRILLAHGADPNAKGKCAGIESIDYNGVSALHMAVAQGDLEKVKLLIQNKANVNAQNNQGQTPLHAVSNVEILNLLIANGADINQKDNHGQTPLHFAVKQGKLSIAQAILSQNKLSVDASDHYGNTALHLATATSFEMPERSDPRYAFFTPVNNDIKKQDNLTMISALINKGADVNKENKYGYTPLHLAVLDGRGTIDYDWVNTGKERLDYQHIEKQVKLLHENRAKLNATSSEDWAKSIDYEQKNPAPGTTPLLMLYVHQSDAANGNEELANARLNVAKYLIENGADPKLTYQQTATTNGLYQEKGHCLLHQCARFADTKAFAYFTQTVGLDPNYQLSDDHTAPLHQYVYWNATKTSWEDDNGKMTMQALVDNHANVNQTCNTKITINATTLGYESLLRTPIISALFKHDNMISQKAKALNLEINDNNAKDQLRAVYAELTKGLPEEQRTLEIVVPLTALEYGYTNSSSSLSPEADEILRNQQEQQPGMETSLNY